MSLKIRRSIVIVSLWIPAVLIAVTWSAWKGLLPEYLPTHWGASGPADDVTHGSTLWGWLLGISLGVALLGSVLLLFDFGGKWTTRGIGASAGFIVGMTGATWLISSATAIGVADPYTVHLGAWILLLMVSPAYGLIALFLLPLGDEPPRSFSDTKELEPYEISEGENPVWRQTITSRMFIVLTVIIIAFTLLLFAIPFAIARSEEGFGSTDYFGVGIPAVVMLASTLLMVVFCRITVTVDQRGLRVESWLFNIPLKRIAITDMQKVEAIFLRPSEWGGWGYRVMIGQSAIVLRAGEGLSVTLKNKKLFGVTVDDASVPASILLTHINSKEA